MRQPGRNDRPMSAPGLKAAWRWRSFAAATALGLARLGFFTPHRHAASATPRAYPGLEPRFVAADPEMRALIAEIDRLGPDLARLKGPPPAPRFDQAWFARLDAAAAYAMVRGRAPECIVEVGSGHSTRFMVRAVADGGLSTTIQCIDPSPRAVLTDLGVDHVPSLLQDLAPGEVLPLKTGDILFIDSSHVAMPGTDVDRLFGDILPRLPSGVLVHIHDIVLPDPYPRHWHWRGYNEQLLVACLIDGGYRLLWSSHWLASRRADWLEGTVIADLPLIEGTPETSVWLEKL